MSKLRIATRKDWDKILDVQNQTLELNQRPSIPITKDEHYSYMEKQEKNPDFFHYFYDEIVYLVVKKDSVTVAIPKEYRNCGFGASAMLELLKIHPTLFATIHIKNTPSFAMFLKVSKQFTLSVSKP